MPGARIRLPYAPVKSVNGIEPDENGNITLRLTGDSIITISPTLPPIPFEGHLHIDNVTWDVFYGDGTSWILKGNIRPASSGGDSMYSYREEMFVSANTTSFTLAYTPTPDIPMTVSINGLTQTDNYTLVGTTLYVNEIYTGDTLRVLYAYRSN